MKLIKIADFLAEFEADRQAATPSAAPAVILNICSNQILIILSAIDPRSWYPLTLFLFRILPGRG